MKVDRELQALVLHHLKGIYPASGADDAFLAGLHALNGNGDRGHLIANILYLEEHGLLVSGLVPRANGNYELSREGMRITAKGIDFLEEDGGLSAILQCVTVRIHDDTLSRLEQFLARAPLPKPERDRLVQRLRELPFAATKHLLCRLLDMALEKSPDALRLIQSLLS